MTVLNEIAARRQHQAQKGYDAAHDDEHNDGSILKAAACYLGRSQGWNPDGYPWGRLPPGSCREDLLDAAALIVAEIERLDRAGGYEPYPNFDALEPAKESDMDFEKRVAAHLPEWQRRQYLSHTPEQAAVEVARERKAMEDGKHYASLTTAEKCVLQGDGFLNDYD